MKSVIIYTYFSSKSSDYNLEFFVKKELKFRENIDYIIVINGYHYNPNIIFPDINNLLIIKRDNIGFDFGGHNSALQHLESFNIKYDYYFFINSGAIGPIVPDYCDFIHWSQFFINKINDNVKLVGTTIACLPKHDSGGYGPKIEGFFFMVDFIGLKLLMNDNNIFCDHKNKRDAIINGEYGLSNCIFKNGFTIDCMLRKYKNFDWRDPNNFNINNNLHPSRHNSYFGKSINPYEVIFHKWFWHNKPNVNFDIIDQYVFENS